MQQSSATQSLHLSFWGLRKIVACSHSSSQCLLVSTVFGTVSSLHPTSFLMIFTLVDTATISPCNSQRRLNAWNVANGQPGCNYCWRPICSRVPVLCKDLSPVVGQALRLYNCLLLHLWRVASTYIGNTPFY